MKKILFISLLVIPFCSNAQIWQYYDSLRLAYEERQIYDTALVYGEKALQLVRDTTGENDTLYATMLETMFYLNYYKGNYKKALEYCEKERNIRRTIQGEWHPDYAEALNNLAALYYFMGEYMKAKPLFKEAMDIRKATFGERYPDYAQSVNNLALLYHYMGEYTASEQLFIVAGNIWKETLGEKHPTYGLLLNNLALLHKETDDYSKAEPMLLEALKIRKETVGENSPDYAQSLNGLAALYDDMGNYIKAEALYMQSKDIYKNVLGEKHPDYANSLNNLSLLYQKMGMYAKAESLNIEAIRLKEESLGKKHPSYAQSIHNLAMLYYKIGNSVLSPAERIEAFAKAEPLYIEAIQIDKEFLGEKHQSYAVDLNNLASLYKDMGYYSKAEPLFIEAKNIWKNSLGEKHHLYASSLSNLAGLYYLMSLSAPDPDHAAAINSKAAPLYLEAIDICYSNIWQNFSFMSEKEKERYFHTMAGTFEGFYSFSLKYKNADPGITKTVFDCVAKNKGLLLKSSTAMRMAILSSKDTALIYQYEKWIALEKEIASLYSTEVSKREKDPETLKQEADMIEKNMVRGSQIFSDMEKLQNLTWEKVKKGLAPGEAAIEFFHFNESETTKKSPTYCALIVKYDSKYPEMIKLFDEDELSGLLGDFGGNDISYVNGLYGTNQEINDKLYKLIWAPLEKYLNEIKTIYYSPDGLLHKVSFAALSNGKNTYLCDNYDMRQLGTTGKIVSDGDDKPSTDRIGMDEKYLCVGLFGGIEYSTSADSAEAKVWSYLPGTKAEIDNIDQAFQREKIKIQFYTGDSATESNFKSIAGECDIIHLSTHGFFFPDPEEVLKEESQRIEITADLQFRGTSYKDIGFGLWNFVKNKNPLMRSGLVLAGANRIWSNSTPIGEDGVLTALEVTQVDLRRTNLVVLSACETGLGDIKGSEGVYGLQRAFKMAGVKYIIMSLWQVPDKETVEFMEMFYKKLLKSKDVRSAFNDTQKEMRGKYDPYFWGAFVLVE